MSDPTWLADDDAGTTGLTRPGWQDPDPRRLEAARAVAEWNLGSKAWADRIITAYLNPTQAMHDLREEKAPEPVDDFDAAARDWQSRYFRES